MDDACLAVSNTIFREGFSLFQNNECETSNFKSEIMLGDRKIGR